MDEHLRKYLDRELTPSQRSDADSGAASKRYAIVVLLAFLGAYGCMSLASSSLDQAVAEQDKREKTVSPFSKSAGDGQDGRTERAMRERALREERERAEREAAKVWNSDPTSFGY